jgi:NTE family protein
MKFRTLVLLFGVLLSFPRTFVFSAETSDDDFLAEALWPHVRDMTPAQRPKIALVLGGGGARGLAHIGVLKVLQKEKIPVDLIVGTSVGALVGALYATGLPLTTIERLGIDIGWSSLTNFSSARLVRLLINEELLSTKKMEDYLHHQIGDKSFADLKIPFACVAVDLKTGERIVMREGSVALAARASATMPGVFRPAPYRHRLLVDGGIVDNVPTEVAKLLGADIILCVNVPANFSKYTVSNVLTTMAQVLYIQGQVISSERLGLADVVITPAVEDVTSLELWKSRQCIEAGEAAARAALPELRRVLVKRLFPAWVKNQPSP